MKKNAYLWIALILAGALGSPLRAQTTNPAAGKSSVQTSDDSSIDDSEEKLFTPYYENEFELSSANQQAGQSTNTLAYTGTFHLTEGGHFLSAGAQTSRQKIEGVASSTGTLVLGGCLGLGFFSPSLNLDLGGGQQGWHQIGGDLTLDFQLWDPLAVDLVFGGTAGYHQTPASDLMSILPGNALVDTTTATSSLGFTFTPWDWWSISPTLEYENDGTNITYRGIIHKLANTDRVATLTLGMDFTIFKNFILGIAPQAGTIYYPAGISYSVETGGLVANTEANSQNFVGGTVSISYSFK